MDILGYTSYATQVNIHGMDVKKAIALYSGQYDSQEVKEWEKLRKKSIKEYIKQKINEQKNILLDGNCNPSNDQIISKWSEIVEKSMREKYQLHEVIYEDN